MMGKQRFRRVTIRRVVRETADARSYALAASFPYRAGQFVTVRACGTLRSYSMSSSPDTDGEPAVTVKRVPGGLVSNWMIDHLGPGDVVEVSGPAGLFCLRETAAPLVALAGGSGITPVLSLVKSALATTGRRVRVLAADRDAGSVIFGEVLAGLAGRYPGRFEVVHHLDSGGGYLTEGQVREFAGADAGADFYLCGPGAFMEMARRALLAHGADAGQILTERFDGEPPGLGGAAGRRGRGGGLGLETGGTVTIVLGGKRHLVPGRAGETLLESARRAGLAPPFSCEAGNCATCLARVTDGAARMRVNDALEDDEVADGWVLTCQGVPVTADITVEYED